VATPNPLEGRQGPSVGVRVSNDRENVVIIFGNENDVAYYGTFDPEAALRIAAGIKKHADAILQLRSEITH
jgi:hypothetical protein